MNEFAELLARLNDPDNPLSDDELAELDSKIKAVASEIDPTSATDDDLQVLTEAKESAEKVRTEIETRASAAEERATKAQELIDAVVPKDETPPEQVPDNPNEDDDGEENETPPVEVETEVNVEEVQEPVAAAAKPKLPTISRLAQRRPMTHQPVETKTSGAKPLIASADMPGLSAGSFVDLEEFAKAASRKMSAVMQSRNGANGEKIHFGSVQFDYPEDRQLSLEDHIGNTEKIEAVTSPEALTAAGGICGPVGADYTVAGVSNDARPVRDSLAQFQAARGGVRFVRPFTLAAIEAQSPNSVGVWTAANDANPSSPTTKPHATFTCQTVQEVLVNAITSIAQIGNFQARSFPEQVENFLETIAANHARVAESTLLAAITTGSTATTTALNVLGATRDVFPAIDRAASAIRYRHRMAQGAPMRLMYPMWFNDEIRADLMRQMPGDRTYAVTDAEIADMWRARNINVTLVQDSETSASPLQGYVTQGVGTLLPFPSKVIAHLFPEGSWMFVDGGELNLGMVRDSTLNATNDAQFFAETFENVAFRGVESLKLTIDVCASGEAAALQDSSAICTSGS